MASDETLLDLGTALDRVRLRPDSRYGQPDMAEYYDGQPRLWLTVGDEPVGHTAPLDVEAASEVARALLDWLAEHGHPQTQWGVDHACLFYGTPTTYKSHAEAYGHVQRANAAGSQCRLVRRHVTSCLPA